MIFRFPLLSIHRNYDDIDKTIMGMGRGFHCSLIPKYIIMCIKAHDINLCNENLQV